MCLAYLGNEEGRGREGQEEEVKGEEGCRTEEDEDEEEDQAPKTR